MAFKRPSSYVRVYGLFINISKNLINRHCGWTTEWDETQLLKQESCCFWWRLSLEGVAHRDHVQTLARGGLNHVSNLIWACPPCNLDKSASEPKSWIRNATRISEERKLVLERILVIPLSTEDTYNFISNLDPRFDPATEDPDQLVEFDVIQLSLFNEKIVE